MPNFLKLILAEIAVVLISFALFSGIIPRVTRHRIWEKYVSSFAKFVVYIFIVSVAITAITAFIVYRLRLERYFNVIAALVQSVLIGFVASCVPRRGVGDKEGKGEEK